MIPVAVTFILCVFLGMFHSSYQLDSQLIPSDSNQVIVVKQTAKGPQAKVILCERSKQGWKKIASMNAVIGRNGISPKGQKREGDGKTPAGVYKLGTAFGYADHIDSQMPYRQTTADDVWVDDPKSKEYNHWINIKNLGDAQSYERLRRDDALYEAGIVIEYNTDPVVPGNGSAIFLHVWRAANKPTAGCVALSKKDVLRILKWLKPSYNPVIAIN